MTKFDNKDRSTPSDKNGRRLRILSLCLGPAAVVALLVTLIPLMGKGVRTPAALASTAAPAEGLVLKALGSTGGVRLAQPIVGMAATPDGKGYWMVAKDGGIFAFGDARFFGSTGGVRLAQPIVGMAATPDGKGYWMVASDGGIFSYGKATFTGSGPSTTSPVIGIEVANGGTGYWEIKQDGSVAPHGTAPKVTSALPNALSVVAVAGQPSSAIELAYVTPDGQVFGGAESVRTTSGTANTHTSGGASPPTSASTLPIPTTSTVPPGAPPTTSIVPPTTSSGTSALQFGAYVGAGNPEGMANLDSRVARPLGYGSDYFDDRSWSGIDDDIWAIDLWNKANVPMIWGVPLFPITGNYSLIQGATGAYDNYFTTLADTLVANHQGNSILRLGWEFNTSTSPWYAANQADTFVSYWRQIVLTMRAVPGQHFKFEWNPSIGDSGASDAAMGNLASYFPGSAYVDYVGVDIYDVAYLTYPGEAKVYQSYLTRNWGLEWLQAFAQDESENIILPEVGLGFNRSSMASGGDDPAFINDIVTWANSVGADGLVYWDAGSSSIEAGNNPNTSSYIEKTF
ncbi:MAG TPA: hypothetical protein VG435_14065 [Acidimicrobiales bacterium]|nr:hypothetical protein [Acidimicrobiales bacterium]